MARIISSPQRDILPLRSLSPHRYLEHVSQTPPRLTWSAGTERDVDGGAIGQRHHWTDTGVVIRRRHTSSSRTMASKRRCRMSTCSRSTRRTMSIGSTSTARSGRFSTSLDAGFKLHRARHSNLRPKLRKVRAVVPMAMAFHCSTSRWVSSIHSGCQRLHMHRAKKPHPHHLRHAARIVAVRLVDCAFSTARMCRVSTQITGKPASASALNSHCDSGPSFQANPREPIGRVLFSTASRASGSLAVFTSRMILPVSSTMQTLVSLTDTSSPPKWSMLRFSF